MEKLERDYGDPLINSLKEEIRVLKRVNADLQNRIVHDYMKKMSAIKSLNNAINEVIDL